MPDTAMNAPRLAFATDHRLSPNTRSPEFKSGTATRIFESPRAFAEGGVGQLCASVGPDAFRTASLSAMMAFPSDIPSPEVYAHFYGRIDAALTRLETSGDRDDWRDLRDMVRTGRRGGDYTMLAQTPFESIVSDVVNRKLQMAPMGPDATYEMWTSLYSVDFWRDEGYRISELHGVRGPAPILGTDTSAPARVHAEDSEQSYHMRVYAKELEIRWYDAIADNYQYVPEMLRQLRMAMQDTEGILAADLVVDATGGVDPVFFTTARRNLIGYSGNYGIGEHPGVSDLAIETAFGEYSKQISREEMPIGGEAKYIVAAELSGMRAKRTLGAINTQARGTAVEVGRFQPFGYLSPEDVIIEKYFKTALDNPTGAGNAREAADGLWMVVGDGMERPPAFIRVRHREYMTPMMLRRNPQWGMGEIEPSNHLLFTMIGFGQYDYRGAAASRNGLALSF
jgi:hypothetical protein